jgi:hypothetical protein
MADYVSKCRSNYFSVTDEAKFRGLMDKCVGAEEDVLVIDQKQKDGSKKFAFSCRSSIVGLLYKTVGGEPVVVQEREEADEDQDNEIATSLFYDSLQGIIPDSEAIMLTEIGREGMKYLMSRCTIITNKDIKGIDLQDEAIKLVRKLLGKPNYKTESCY